MDMEIFCRKKPWSFVGFIPRFYAKTEFSCFINIQHPSLRWKKHHQSVSKKPSTDITRSRNCPKHSQNNGSQVSHIYVPYNGPRGVLWEWGSHSWEFLGYSLYHSWDHPPLSPPLHQTGRRNEVVGTFISCSSLRRAVKSERKAAVLGDVLWQGLKGWGENPFHRWQTYSTKIISIFLGYYLDFTSCGWKDKLFFSIDGTFFVEYGLGIVRSVVLLWKAIHNFIFLRKNFAASMLVAAT